MYEANDRTFPLTRGQRDIWNSREMGSYWHIGATTVIDGDVDIDLLRQALRQMVSEAEPLRVRFAEVDGEVTQEIIDLADFEIPLVDLAGKLDRVETIRDLTMEILAKPISMAGPLFTFTLFRTRADHLRVFWCVHHIVADGHSTVTLCGNRTAEIYSALMAGEPAPPSRFGSLRDLVRHEATYEVSTEYLDDLNYWTKNAPPVDTTPNEQSFADGLPDQRLASAPVGLSSTMINRARELAAALGVRRCAILTAACALLVRAGQRDKSEVVLDFPVSRRTDPTTMSFPGLVAGMVPLTLRFPTGAGIDDFCRQVDTKIREALRHQRFSAQAIGADGHPIGAGARTSRISINFIPPFKFSTFAGTPAWGLSAAFGGISQFNFYLLTGDGRVSLATSGSARPFADFAVGDIAEQLDRILAGITSDSRQPLETFDPRKPSTWQPTSGGHSPANRSLTSSAVSP